MISGNEAQESRNELSGSMIGDRVGAALAYAKMGWSVIAVQHPVEGKCSCGNEVCTRIGKHPCYHADYLRDGVKSATTDKEIIELWWIEWSEANIGIATGSRSGIVVLDVDPRHDGDQSLKELEERYGKLPPTVTSITGGGGRHIIFQYPGVELKNRIGIAPGLDVRADEGYIVAPPSLHASGNRYEWESGKDPEGMQIATMPQWLLDLILAPKRDVKKPEQEASKDSNKDVIPEGKRNDTLMRFAGKLRAKAMGYEEILSALTEENNSRCNPPLSEDEVRKIAESVSRYEPGEEFRPGNSTEGDGTKGRGPSKADLLLEIAKDIPVFHTPDGDAYGIIRVNGHREIHDLNSEEFRNYLAREFYLKTGKTASAQAHQEALSVLLGKARYDSSREQVFCRVAYSGKEGANKEGAVYLDLGNDAWEAVKITKDGWEVVSEPPVYFRRADGMLPLPYPESGGSVDYLREFINVSDEDWPLVVGWLIGALGGMGPYPILILQGEQGSAKSTTSKICRELVDPSSAPLRTLPSSERDLVIDAKNSWVLAFDNLSGLSRMSDAFCRLSTGGGLATRKLYSNANQMIFDAMRPIILNGIEDLASRNDLADRSLIVNLKNIPESQRKFEQELWTEFNSVKPKILGSFLDAVSTALREWPKVEMESRPRMADFARLVSAAEASLPWPKGSFMQTYGRMREESAKRASESDIFAMAVLAFMRENLKETVREAIKEQMDKERRFSYPIFPGTNSDKTIRSIAERTEAVWEGTATELLVTLEKFLMQENKYEQDASGIMVDNRDPMLLKILGDKFWPKMPNILVNRMNRSAPILRQEGVGVESRTIRGKKLWKLRMKVADNHEELEGLVEELRKGSAGQRKSKAKAA